MSEFLPTMAISLILAILSHFSSAREPFGTGYIKKERLFFLLMSVVLILFVGLRTAYNDTFTYLHNYENTDITRSILNISWLPGDNPGYNAMCILLRRMGLSGQSYLMFYAVVTVGIYLWFIRKYTENIWLSVLLFITIGNYTFTMAAIKQCVAIAFCLVGVDRAIQKKWKAFVLWVLLGMLFHPYSLMYLAVPFLMFCPWSGRTYVLLGIFALVGPMIQRLMGSVINVTTLLGEGFSAENFAGEGVNVLRFAVMLVPIALSFVAKMVILHRNDRVNNLLMNLTMLNGFIMYVALFGTANYFARLANYFVIFQTVTLPWLFSCFEKKSRFWITAGAAVCYFLFFYYEFGINQPLDYYYASTTLWQYLKSLF